MVHKGFRLSVILTVSTILGCGSGSSGPTVPTPSGQKTTPVSAGEKAPLSKKALKSGNAPTRPSIDD